MLTAFLRMILRNAWRHRLRAGLTVLGMVVAILAYGLLGTVVDAWYAGAEGASANRLITRSSISLVFPLPLTYRDRIRGVEGVRDLSWASWFGGIYKEPKNFFAQFAVDGESYFRIYPEFVVDERAFRDFLRDRRGCVVGRKLAETYGFKVGDTLTLKGTIYPGNWDFVVRAIYDGARKGTDQSQMLFHWQYLDETIKQRYPGRANNVGVFVTEVASPDQVAAVSRAVDREFANSRAETLTETEKAFQLSFVAMTEAIVVAIRIVSYLVIFIIMAVMANTMAMTARERTAEYATLKALGFAPAFVGLLILGESLMLALTGGAIGIALTFPVADAFAAKMGTLFPVFNVSTETVALQIACALTVGMVAALLPMLQVGRLRIVDGLRAVG
ncbi:MAG TPA: ABC transporter permease [Rhodocyclaceae bacterium]|nr:ABC transporter permease [Rhodocyclaceae bacterium]HNA66424.1 ABC transporter permease [Rhodocyclaceae bacterium]